MLFQPGTIGRLTLPNRLVRSATAETLADPSGRPLPQLAELYRRLARGGVGLLITGHLYVDPRGKAHPGMTAIDSDDCVERLGVLAEAVHAEGGRIAAQINHAGRQVHRDTLPNPMAPSDSEATTARAAAHAMSEQEIEETIAAYAHAARRAKSAGIDAVQLHAAHGYLINQFLSPLTNRRTDTWGGSLRNRLRFLASVAAAVRTEVGEDYPVFAKLGMRDASEDGLSLDEGCEIVAAFQSLGLDAVEISGGIADKGGFNINPNIAPGLNEATFRTWAQAARAVAGVPIILVGGMRSRAVMEDVLTTGDAQFVSMCRPLICEPDLPEKLRLGTTDASACVSHNRCWPDEGQVGIACKCPGVVRR